ncbi:MAG: aminodeoxychorismate/anthranilate synthase component II [Bacteroidia bacterium]|nr:aminodeoxychorismate/anthranilate synthase component II [Bacteroidia bacterium]
MILVVDNYDSFTFNLVELIRRESEVVLIKNDAFLGEISRFDHIRGILISPGPGKPSDSGISAEAIRWGITSGIPVLGICLGHQLMGEMFGAKIIHGLRPMHGKTSPIHHHQKGIFRGIETPMTVMRYHSLIIDKVNFPTDLEITAYTTDGEIMGIRHKFHSLAGVQFHPESILTPKGSIMIHNWIESLPPAKAEGV